MLVKPSIDELLPKTQNRYTLAVLVAKRARQLAAGAQPLIESKQPNVVTLASEEVAASAVVGVPGEHQPEVPLRPEVIAAQEAARQQEQNQQSMDAIRKNFGLEDEREKPQLSILNFLDESLEASNVEGEEEDEDWSDEDEEDTRPEDYEQAEALTDEDELNSEADYEEEA